MRNFYILIDALDYIEDNLFTQLSCASVAKECYISLSGMQKLFRYALHISLNEYIVKRRLTKAADDLLNTDMSVVEIAFKYQYNSPEVFTRAFKKQWDISPSRFKYEWRFSGLFPKIEYNEMKGESLKMARRKFDYSKDYEKLRNIKNTYVIGFDVCNLMSINDISREVGDKVILETAKRINSILQEGMMLFRIGGDEFALVTGLADHEIVKNMAKEVIDMNGQAIIHGGLSIPFSLHSAITMMPDTQLRYSEFFTNIQNAIYNSKS